MDIKLGVLDIIVSVQDLISIKMFLLAVICLFAITTASPDLEVSSSTEPQAVTDLETELYTNVPNSETTEKYIIESQDDIIKNEEEKVTVLPSFPPAPELLPLDESIMEMLLRIQLSRRKPEEKTENDKEPQIIRWKVPKIRFPGGYIVNDVYGPDVTLKG